MRHGGAFDWSISHPLVSVYEVTVHTMAQGDASAAHEEQPASSDHLLASSASATAFAASVASQAGEATGHFSSRDANVTPRKVKTSSPADPEYFIGTAQQEHQAHSSAEDDAILVGVQARAASPPAVSAADASEHQRARQGDAQRHSFQQQARAPLAQQHAVESSSDAHRDTAGFSRWGEQQSEQWQTLPNGTAGDGWQSSNLETTAAAPAIAGGTHQALSAVGGLPGRPPGPSTASISTAPPPESSARTAQAAEQLHYHGNSAPQLSADPVSDSAARSNDLATALEFANGVPEDHPVASAEHAVQHSTANGDAAAKGQANGPVPLEHVAIDDDGVANLSGGADLNGACAHASGLQCVRH